MGMTERVREPEEKTLGEFIDKRYRGFTIKCGSAPMDTDISHGIDVLYANNRDHGHGEYVKLMPYVKWSDGGYAPCDYWGTDKYIVMERR